MSFGLEDNQLQEIRSILARFNEIESAVIFGSRAEGSNREASDVDIAVKGSRITYSITLEIKDSFEESYLPYFFDVVDYFNLKNDKLKGRIDKYGQVLYINSNT
ncbi:MAG: polymerase, beta domain protein region [Ignavibacteria bacterium]|nr:polymerase, beta domain protein region [Ignavibacteria bacterium]